MQGNTLMEIMQSPNWSMWGPSTQAFNLEQQKQKASLDEVQGREKRAVEMQPYEIQHRRALTEQSRQQARTQQIKSDLEESIPLADRSKVYFSDLRKKMNDNDLSILDNNMKALQHFVSKASSGQLGLGDLAELKKYPGMEKFVTSPQGIKAGQAALEAYARSQVDYIKSMDIEKERGKRAVEVANINQAGQTERKGMGQPSGDVSIATINAQLTKMKKASEKLAHLKVMLPQLNAIDPEAAQAFAPTYAALKQQAEEELRAKTAGQVDVGATSGGSVKVTPSINLGESVVAPRAPAQQKQYTQADLEYTAKKHNISVEEVKKKLGIK